MDFVIKSFKVCSEFKISSMRRTVLKLPHFLLKASQLNNYIFLFFTAKNQN